MKPIELKPNYLTTSQSTYLPTQGMIDGSASKPALRQDTGYMVDKTYHIAPYFGAFGTI